MNNPKIDRELLFAKNAITNAMNVNPISVKLATLGYDNARLSAGNTLYENTVGLHETQKREYGEQYGATQELQLARTEANNEYIKLVKIGRIAFKNNTAATEALQLNGRRKKTMSGWLAQAGALYNNALASTDIQARYATFGITKEMLEAGKNAVEGVKQKYHLQMKEIGEAQQATQERDTSFDQLEEWISDFKVIARIALEDQPQYLEMLGIVEPS